MKKAPCAQLYVHLVWATWDRLPLLVGDVERAVYLCIRAECTRLKVEVLELGGIEDHVHLLARIPTTLSVAELVKQVKGSSSHLATHRPDWNGEEGFKWQGSYGAFTVSRWDLSGIRLYIQNQKVHHRDESLRRDLETVWDEGE